MGIKETGNVLGLTLVLPIDHIVGYGLEIGKFIAEYAAKQGLEKALEILQPTIDDVFKQVKEILTAGGKAPTNEEFRMMLHGAIAARTEVKGTLRVHRQT